MSSAFDPICDDLPDIDPVYPPVNVEAEIPTADGTRLNGLFMRAQGAGVHPTIAFLHGFPGNERALDLAQIVRRAGWNALYFNYRGSWGMPGVFRFAHVLEDAKAAAQWLVSEEATRDYGVESSRVVLAGHSMGGWAALHTAAIMPGLLGVIGMAAWNIGAWAQAAAQDEDSRFGARLFLEASLKPLAGVTAEALLDETFANTVQHPHNAWDLRSLAPSLVGRRVLLVVGEEDNGTPPELHQQPLVRALHTAGQTVGAVQVEDHIIPYADHGFAARRVALARIILNWLNTL